MGGMGNLALIAILEHRQKLNKIKMEKQFDNTNKGVIFKNDNSNKY